MPDKSALSVRPATKRRLEETDDDSDCEIIEVTPSKRVRRNSTSVPNLFSNFFKKIGEWFKRTSRSNTHIFGVPAESNSAADAIAHGGQYLDEASKDKFMPRHKVNGNGSSGVKYPPSVGGGKSNPSNYVQRPAAAPGPYPNGEDFYEQVESKTLDGRPKNPQTSRSDATPNVNLAGAASRSDATLPAGYSHGSSTYNSSLGLSETCEQLNGSLQKSYIDQAVKQRRASAKSTLYDKSYLSVDSPPLFTAHEKGVRNKRTPGFDLEEKERYKALLKQYALRTDSSSEPEPAFSTERLSLSKLSTNPGSVHLKPLSELYTVSTQTRTPADDTKVMSDEESLLFPVRSKFSQSTPARKKLPPAKMGAPAHIVTSKPSDIAVHCTRLVKKMQDLKEKSLNRLAQQKVLRAEELKLAEWDRLREEEDKHLEQMVQQRLRLSAKVILEDLPPPEVEEDEFPDLSDEAEAAVRRAWSSPPNMVLSDAFRIKITAKDMATLYAQNWLNDEIVNFYFSLIQDRSGKDNLPSVHVFNTFFLPKVIKDGHKGVRRWTRQVDIFKKDLLFIPVHLGMHWCLACVSLRDKTIRYFDSMGGDNKQCLTVLCQYLKDESLDKKKQVFDTSDWQLECVKGIPQQMNGSDCGVFSCKYAEYLSRDAKFSFSQENMQYFRRRMVYEILTKKLL